MNIKDASIEELFVFFNNIEEKRGVDVFEVFLAGSEKRVSIENFFNILHENGKCSKLFMKKYFEEFPNHEEIFFNENLLKFIKKNELFDLESSKKVFIYLLSCYVKFTDCYVFLALCLCYLHKLGVDKSLDEWDELMEISPIFYTAYKDTIEIPAFVLQYSLFIEREDEDTVLETIVDDIAMSPYKRDYLIEIVDVLEETSLEIQIQFIKELKNILGL